MTHSMSYRELIATDRLQFMVFLGLSLGTVALTAIAYSSNPLEFQRFLGNLNPLAAITVIAVVGGILLSILLARNWFLIWIPGEPRRFVLAAGLAILMAMVMILVDTRVVFNQDLNVLFPQSLSYYPVIDYAVQILFHVLPLSLFLILTTSITKDANYGTMIWPCLLLAASLEPILQITFFAGQYPIWVISYVALHVFAFNIIELTMFKRYDFISMYSFRFAYYIAWHIVWGYLRMRLLF
jgi:hypothetical protein